MIKTKKDILKDFIIKTHVRGFFDTDLHEVSWHFATPRPLGRVGS